MNVGGWGAEVCDTPTDDAVGVGYEYAPMHARSPDDALLLPHGCAAGTSSGGGGGGDTRCDGCWLLGLWELPIALEPILRGGEPITVGAEAACAAGLAESGHEDP